MNRRQSLEKGILSPSGFLTPSQSPSIQHSPRLQPSPSQSPFQPQDVLLVTNNNQHFINTFSATQEQDRKSGTPNRRSSLNHISPNANIVYRPSPTQSPAGIVNEINTTLVGSNNISLNKKGKRTPNAGQYGASSANVCSPKAAKKAMALVGSPIASPSASPQPSAVIQQFPMMNANNSIVFMQQPTTSHRASIIQTSNTQQSNFIATSSSSTSNAKHNKAPQQILPKPASSSSSNNPGTASLTSSTLTTQSLITSTSTKQITQSKMAILQQQQQAQNQQFQSPPHQSPHQIITTASQPGSESSSPQPQQITTQGGSILLPTGAQPLLLNQMPVLVQQNTAQGVQLILRQPPSQPQLAAPSLVIHNRSGQMQQNQPQAGQLVRILNTNGMQLATAATPAFIVSSQANIIQQNLQSIKTPTNNSSQMNQLSGIQQNQQQTSRQHQQIINSHILGQSVAQIQNLQLNGNLTQIQMPNGQILQQLPAQFSQNLGSFNQIQPLGSQIAAINATFQSPPSNSQNDIVPTVVSSTLNPIQFTTNQQNPIAMTQGAQIISPGTTPQPQIIQSDSILSSPPSITFNSQPHSAVLVQSGDKQMHEMSSPPPFSIIQQSTGNAEMINLDMTHHHTPQPQTVTKPARKPKKSKKKQALEEQQLQMQLQQQQQQQQQQLQQQQQQQMQIFSNQSTNIITNEESSMMLSPNRNNNSQAPTGKLDLANVIKLCGISEDDDFMDTDDQMDQMEGQQMEQTQTIQIPASNNNSDNNATDIMITIPSNSSDQPPFTLTIPSSSIENSDGSIVHNQNTNADNNSNKMTENVPFMIRFDGDGQSGSQPFTISVPNLNDEMNIEEGKQQDDANANNSNSITCVPSFVNSVLSSSVTPTIQSQINEIQNQLMALPPVTSTVTTKTANVKAPRQKKQTTKKSKKQQEKTIEVPTQIGNIQISQIDGNTMKNTIGSKNINNQIQIMPILEKNSHSTSGHLIEKQKFQIPIMQQTITHQDSNQGQDNKQHHHQQQHNSQSQHSNNSGPSQVNINVQQNQLINVTNNLQMQVIANPQQQHHHHHHHSNATPAPPPPSSSSHQNISHNSSITTQSAINAQNIIGNLINAQQGQGGGNIIIQGASSFNQQQPANIQVNIQNQTIANNIITTAPQSVTQNITTNTHQQQQQPTAQSILSQLTGNLVLSLSEDGRLILHHDPNIPQDEQSQKILEIVLTGALGNVSLINEPLKTPAQNQQQTQHHIIGANGKIQQVSTIQNVQNKNVIITNQTQPQQPQQQIFNNMVQTQSVPSGQIIQNAPQSIQIQQSRIVDNSQQQKPQAVVLPSPNIIKFVELPKIQPNQQLFSLNTITNEITLLNPNQTTAALSPMERLLIVPSGINAQQLAQCLSQGQIHFNNIGQAPTTDPNKVQQQQLHIQQQIQLQQQQMTFKTTKVQNINQTIKKEPVETKPKKGRGKKAKLLEEQMKEIKKEPIQSPPPMKMITTQAQVAIMDTKVIKTTTVMTSSVTTTTNSGSKNTITISPNPTMIVNPTKANITKTTVQANMNATKANKNSITVIPTSTLLPNNVTTATATKIVKGNKSQQIKSSITTQLSPIIASNQQQQTPPPPLVSVNQAPIPRVQTIQLTPQKQQSLKNVQMQIQQLSAKLQNKNLLSTLTSDIDLNNPAFNKPLPALVNINSMSDNEIYEALQRLFIEQQKILATGKIIPTLPAAVSPVTSGGNQTSIRTMQNPSQSLFVNNQNIVAPISTSTSSGASLYSGGNSQKVPSPIQVNSPIVKQESPCSTSTSSQPPPLVVSTPIQMQIKTEILPSPNITAQVPTPIPIIPSANPPATGSIVISPKYTTSTVKITIDPQTQKEQKVPVDSKIDIVPVQSNDIAIEPSAIIKQQQIAAVELNQKKKLTRSSLFERQICVDQEGCTNPDVKTDFSSKEDAVKRLIRYHCLYEEIKNENDPKEEYEFGEQSKLFLASFQAMKEKYQHLLLRQSQQQAPTSELMMLDRLQVADLKDEIVSMQMEINSALFEQQQQQQTESQITIKTEPICQSTIVKTQSSVQHMQNSNLQTQSPGQQQQTHIIQPPPTQRAHFVPSLHEPSQILKAKQEQKLFENIKNERIKIEIPEIPKDNNRKSFGIMVNNSTVQNSSIPSPKSPISSSISPSATTANAQQKGLSKFDKLKNEQINTIQHNSQPSATQQSPQQQQTTLKLINELKDELNDFDIESEIRSNFIMKKCEPNAQQSSSTSTTSVSNKKTSKSSTKEKEKERECSPFSDYLNSVKMELTPSKNKINEVIKSETHDGAYDEWLSIQKELNLHLDASCSNTTNTKRKETSGSSNKNLKIQSTKALESDLSDIFENHNSPKSVEKQLDDLFSSTSKSNDLLNASSPPELNELFHVESTSTMSEKTVENRLEALFGGPEDDAVKSSQQDLVETRLEQLFQSGSVNPNDESALDNASFLYKNSDLTYDEMIQKQIQVTTSRMEPVVANTSNANKRQWSANSCDIFSSSNSGMIFPTSPTTSKRTCTEPSVSFDNKWIDDSFDFGSDINLTSESTSDDMAKHREWNGLDHDMDENQYQIQNNDSSNLHSNHNIQQQQQHLNSIIEQQQASGDVDHMMDTSQINFVDDVDDISRQVQNAIDSILNLQNSDPLHYQLDSSFLELNSITSSSPNSPVSNHQQASTHNITQQNQHHNQYQLHHQDHHMTSNAFSNSTSQKTSLNIPKRKYSRMDDIGDCLIGGSNLDDSPSALSLTLTDSHNDTSSANSVGEFVTNLLNCDEKSITTS